MAGKIESIPNGTAQTVENLILAVQRRRLESLQPNAGISSVISTFSKSAAEGASGKAGTWPEGIDHGR